LFNRGRISAWLLHLQPRHLLFPLTLQAKQLLQLLVAVAVAAGQIQVEVLPEVEVLETVFRNL
jgi:hypothetical protein